MAASAGQPAAVLGRRRTRELRLLRPRHDHRGEWHAYACQEEDVGGRQFKEADPSTEDEAVQRRPHACQHDGRQDQAMPGLSTSLLRAGVPRGGG